MRRAASLRRLSFLLVSNKVNYNLRHFHILSPYAKIGYVTRKIVAFFVSLYVAVLYRNISRVPRSKFLSQSTSGFCFLYHPTDLDEPDKPVTLVRLILQHRDSYKPCKMELSAHLPIFCMLALGHTDSVCPRASISKRGALAGFGCHGERGARAYNRGRPMGRSPYRGSRGKASCGDQAPVSM